MVVCRWVRERTSPPPSDAGLAPSGAGGAGGADSPVAVMAGDPSAGTGRGGEGEDGGRDRREGGGKDRRRRQNSLVRNGFAGASRSGLPRTFDDRA
ncbi:hypothetical protein GCM10017667_44610 [Streptomyces filamentosus]|uniref:Uncharacterized protein n=1 Tax=Streptomyces filamentosus TaxID=67294 RepID=A0A919BSP4_STRFL|nr:hypothetical protein GCM10017667_44610 [Streptomyces filamentosus]